MTAAIVRNRILRPRPREQWSIPAGALVGIIASTDELRLAIRMHAPPDLFELRLDHLPNLRVSQLSRLSRPLIITARHPAEGGKRCNRKNLLRKFLPYAKFVDIELRSMHELREIWTEARRLAVGRICSVHDFKRTPELSLLRKQFSRSRKANADVFKLVTRADSLRNLLTLFEFLWTRSLMPVSVMAVGKFGPISRLLFREAGSAFIYAPLRHALYEGQVTVRQLRGRNL
jgi:3-dehydroquinate dehydratase type I